MNRDQCNAIAVHMGRVGESMMCAGIVVGPQGVCPSTQGGGLICNNQLTAVLTGGFGCGAPNSPGIYTQVGGMITRQVRNKGKLNPLNYFFSLSNN